MLFRSFKDEGPSCVSISEQRLCLDQSAVAARFPKCDLVAIRKRLRHAKMCVLVLSLLLNKICSSERVFYARDVQVRFPIL